MPIPTAPPSDSFTLYTGTAYVGIGDLTIVPGQFVDDVWWDLDAIDGWDAPASVTDRIEQRSADHGGWLRQGYYEPRTLELKGQIVSRTRSSLEQAWALLKSAVQSFDAMDLVVATAGAPVLTASVIQGGAPLLTQKKAVWEFSFSLIAADPRRYAVDTTVASTGLPVTTGGLSLPVVLPLVIGATTTSGTLSVENVGDVATRPTFTITGPCPACAITHSSGRRLNIPDAIDAGRTLTIDTDARSALLDGTASRVVTGTWFELDPGVNEIQFSSSTYDAAALLTVTFRSAWR